jgi:hypothetical protein
MIKIQNNTATRDPLPGFLQGLAVESLRDLSWTDPALGVQDAAWWPEEQDWPALEPGERYTDETLTIDAERFVVISTRGKEPLDGQELADFLDAERDRLTQAATDKRWSVMTGGLTLPGGIAVGTEIDDQNRITSVVANAELAGLTDEDEVDFKAASGWVRISIGQVKAIAGAIGQFVQACYSAERAHHEAIELLETPAEINAYDLDSGWPQTEPETAET